MKTIIVALLLTGCASAPYNPVRGGTENTVTVNWSRVGMEQALSHAEQHCQQHGKHAQFAGKEDFWLFYNCVKS
jgi:hypothetical protein